MVLDSSGQEVLNRVANRTYEQCRSGKMTLSGFPDFQPHITALKNESHMPETTKTYKVTSQVHDKLMILESLAQKWLDEESTQEEARQIIDAHNKEYNHGGELMMDRLALSKK